MHAFDVCIRCMHSMYLFDVYALHVCTGWRRLIGSPKLQINFHKRAIRYRSLLRKIIYKDKGSYESSPPCICCMHSMYVLGIRSRCIIRWWWERIRYMEYMLAFVVCIPCMHSMYVVGVCSRCIIRWWWDRIRYMKHMFTQGPTLVLTSWFLLIWGGYDE